MSDRVCARCGATADSRLGTCPRCKWPLGAKAPGSGFGASKGVTLVLGILGGLFFLSFLAAIFIPNFVDALAKGRQKRTLADLEVVRQALERYSKSEDAEAAGSKYPEATSLAALEPFLVPVYLETMPTSDGWKNEMRYLCIRGLQKTRSCDSFRLVSAGADGFFLYESDRDALFEQYRFPATAYGEDLVVGPEGVVRGPAGAVALPGG